MLSAVVTKRQRLGFEKETLQVTSVFYSSSCSTIY